MIQYIYFYPKWLRIWHQINALMFLMLIITGLSMQYGIFGIRFDFAVSLHNVCGIILVFNYLLFMVGNLLSGNYKYYLLKFNNFFKELKAQFRFYCSGLFKGEKPPFPLSKERKFNPLQKLSYVVVMFVFMPIIILTGIAMLFPQLIINKILGIPGIVLTDLLHIIMGFLGSIFMIVHIYFCTIGMKPGASFKSILNGYQEFSE
ncbi:MAG TPA: cytochrome b/b6 domain-containing protein [Bacteroidales bacterium]